VRKAQSFKLAVNRCGIVAKFKLIISDPASRKVTISELEGPKAQPLIGRELGEVIDGSLIGLGGKRLKMAGGSDKDGIPMRFDIHGGAKKYVVLASGTGFKPKSPGERRRKLVRGRMITEETYQLNLVVEKQVEEKTEKKIPSRKAGPSDAVKGVKSSGD